MIVGKASTSPNDFLPLPTQPTFLEDLLSHRRRARSRQEAKKEIKKGIKKDQREDVAEEKIE